MGFFRVVNFKENIYEGNVLRPFIPCKPYLWKVNFSNSKATLGTPVGKKRSTVTTME